MLIRFFNRRRGDPRISGRPRSYPCGQKGVEQKVSRLCGQRMSNTRNIHFSRILMTAKPVSAFDLSARYHSYEIGLAKRGMSSSNVDEFLVSDMCIPILPAPEHPLGRKPMNPSRPLPWHDCYHSSFFCTTTVRVQPRYAKFRAAAELPVKELTRHERIMRNDQLRRRDLCKFSSDSSCTSYCGR